MNTWTDFFDQIFLINLRERPDKLQESQVELNTLNIRHIIYEAIGSEESGSFGLMRTMYAMFVYCLRIGWKKVLVVEDDVHFVLDPVAVMPAVLFELPKDWHMIHLGPNTHEPLEKVSPHLLLMKKCRSTHAVIYSEFVMQTFVDAVRKSQYSGNFASKYDYNIDLYFESEIQPLGKSYCTFPLIATQRNGFSDISRRQVDQSYIVERFKENTKHLSV